MLVPLGHWKVAPQPFSLQHLQGSHQRVRRGRASWPFRPLPVVLPLCVRRHGGQNEASQAVSVVQTLGDDWLMARIIKARQTGRKTCDGDGLEPNSQGQHIMQ